MQIETDLLTGQRTYTARIPLVEPPATCVVRTSAQGNVLGVELTVEGQPERFLPGGDYGDLLTSRGVVQLDLADFPRGTPVAVTLSPHVDALDELPHVNAAPDVEQVLMALLGRMQAPWRVARLEALA